MTAEQFAYWLQGFMEICNPETLDEEQTQIIKDHLALVFNKQTPDRTVTVAPANPTWSQPIMPQWQEPHIPVPPPPPDRTNPICGVESPYGLDFTKKFC
jgi:hypothetical protein